MGRSRNGRTTTINYNRGTIAWGLGSPRGWMPEKTIHLAEYSSCRILGVTIRPGGNSDGLPFSQKNSAGLINPQSQFRIYVSVALEYQAQLIRRAFKVWSLI